MFQKKEYIFSDSIGPCMVEDIVKLAAQKNATPVLYYVLRSTVDKKKTSYIPVENHRSLLRPLVSLQEAQEVLAAAWERKRREEELAKGAENGTLTAEQSGIGIAEQNGTAKDAAEVQDDGLREKLLQEAMFVVEQYEKRLEELKGKDA